MAAIYNAAIELPETVFEITLVVFGTLTRNAIRRTISVLAQTPKGAKKICKLRYRRSAIERICVKNRDSPELFFSPVCGHNELTLGSPGSRT
jgi:hypothetical protein